MPSGSGGLTGILTGLVVALSLSATQARPAESRSTLSFTVAWVGPAVPWTVARQALVVPSTAGFVVPRYDTLRLSRRIDPGPAVGVGFTWFPHRVIGVHVGAAYLLPMLSTQCSMVFEDLAVDTTRMNGQMCGAISSASTSAGTLVVGGDGVVRLKAGSGPEPSLRVGAGVAVRDFDPIGVAGTSSGVLRTVFRTQSAGLTPMLDAALSVTTNASPALRVRAEVLGRMLSMPFVTGPMGALAEGNHRREVVGFTSFR